MSGICDTCRRNPCRLRAEGLKMCDLHKGGETRWQSLFGTPERAARTIAVIMDKCSSRPHVCGRCKLFDACDDDVNALEWLRGDA